MGQVSDLLVSRVLPKPGTGFLLFPPFSPLGILLVFAYLGEVGNDQIERALHFPRPSKTQLVTGKQDQFQDISAGPVKFDRDEAAVKWAKNL